VQFNDGGAFGGDGNLAYDKTTTTLNSIQYLVDGTALIKMSAARQMDVQLDGSTIAMNLRNTSATLTDTASFTVMNADETVSISLFVNLIVPGKIAVFSSGALYLHTGNPNTDDVIVESGLRIDNGYGVHPTQTAGQVMYLQAYDTDGFSYSNFVTLTTGATPSCEISEPAGGSLLVKPPTADPHVAGALWNNSGLAMISSG